MTQAARDKSFSITKDLANLMTGIACLWLVAYGTDAHAIKANLEDTNSALSIIQKKLDSVRKSLGKTEEDKQEASKALKKSEIAISKSKKKLYELQQITKKNAQKRKLLNTSLTKTQQHLSQQKVILSKQLYQQYTLGQQDYLHLIIQDISPNALSRDLAYFGYISKAFTRNVQALQQNLIHLKALNANLEAAQYQAEQLQAEQLKQQTILEVQKKLRAKAVATLTSEANKQRSTLKKLKQDEQGLTALMVKLTKDSEKKSVAQRKKKSKVVATNQLEPDSSTNSNRFRKLKGKLRLPIKGQLINRYGQARTETGITWKGLFIKAQEGTRVKSVAQGKVVFANWMRGFGNLIIIDHGEGYMSLYGNNESLYKSVGAKVKSGDVIAAVGNSGGNENIGLYYELRKKSKPFDPLGWSRLK